MTADIAWPKVRLGNLAEFRNGVNYNKDSFGEGIKVVGVSNFQDYTKPKYAELAQINPDGIVTERNILRDGDIVFVRSNGNRELIGRSLFIEKPPEDVTHSAFSIRLRFKSVDVCPKFYAYFFRTPQIRQSLTAQGGGTNINNLNQEILNSLEVPLPPISVQQRIADILSAYDDLIENSQRRIKILESMARALYREWFVNFRFPGHEGHPRVASPLGEIPKGWEVKKLGEIVDNFDRLRKPLSKMKRSEIQGEYPYYGAAKVFDYVNDYIFDGEYLLMAEDGSVTTTERAPVLQLVHEQFWPNNHTHVLRGRPPFSTHFLYLGLSEVDISPYITGAAQPKITQENMNRIPFFCGPKELHHGFNCLVEPMIRQSQNLQRQVQNLRRTRDLLLPRLLSGQIDVEVA